MSCGRNRHEDPPINCLHTGNHPLPRGQVWVRLNYPEGARYESRGTGVIFDGDPQ